MLIADLSLRGLYSATALANWKYASLKTHAELNKTNKGCH